MHSKPKQNKALGRRFTLTLLIGFLVFTMGGIAYQISSSSLFKGQTAIEYDLIADLVEDALDEATDDGGGAAIEYDVIADAVEAALAAAMEEIRAERELRLRESDTILDLIRDYVAFSEGILDQVSAYPEDPQLNRIDRQTLEDMIDEADEKITLLELYYAEAVEQEDIFREIYYSVAEVAGPLLEYDAIEEAYSNLQEAIAYREALENQLNLAYGLFNTLIRNYNEILGFFDEPRALTFKVKVFDWKGDFVSGLDRTEIKLSEGDIELAAGIYTIQENADHYALTFSAVPGTLYSLFAQVDGYVGQRFKNKISTADSGKTYTMNLQATYVFEVQDSEDDSLISGASVSVGSIVCEEDRDHLYYCEVPSDSTASTYRISKSTYETKEADLLFPRDGDFEPSQLYTVSLVSEDADDDGNDDGDGVCESLNLRASVNKIKEDDEPKRVTLTVEIEASDSDWEGELILSENGDEFESEQVDGKDSEERFTYDARIGDSVTAYIDGETDDCFDSLAFTEDFTDILSDEDYECTDFFKDNNDDLLCRMREAGIIEGVGNGYFGDRDITEAEWVRVLLSSQGYTESDARGLPSVSYLPNYNDTSWYDAWYRIAVDKKIIRGYVEPNASITRARASVLATRAPQSGELTLFNWGPEDVPFDDLQKDPRKPARTVKDYIEETYAIIILSEAEADLPGLGDTPVIVGFSDDTFRPYETIEREHAMYLLYRWILAFELSSPLEDLE